YKRTRKDGATGVDGQTADEYAANLTANLQRLLERAKSGTYVAPPVRRVHIQKGKGDETRPLGIPTFEDKVLQRAVAMVLGAIYEQDFYDSSYGFRPGRSAHQALEALWKQTMKSGGGWVVEIDVRKFLDVASYCTSMCLLPAEEPGQRVGDFDSQPFSSPAAHMKGGEFAPLYTLQDGLARDAENAHGVDCDRPLGSG
ncbi:MAG: reverse transcriptase domain-containing protein, partial [Polyangiaceae bacterium]